MNNIITKLYGLTNLALLTPQNLVENICLDNYHEIKYSTKDNEIICEMIVEDEEGDIFNCTYYFNMDNKLNRAYALYEKERIEIFDRKKEIKCLLNGYDEEKKSQIA